MPLLRHLPHFAANPSRNGADHFGFGFLVLEHVHLLQPLAEFFLVESPLSSDFDGGNFSAFRPQAHRPRGDAEPFRNGSCGEKRFCPG
jgi:hypothetical protein